MGRVEGKVAFITGAARGMGRAHAVRLAEEGADIIAIDACADIPGAAYPGATEEDLAQTVAEVEALGRRIVATKADVRDLAGLQDAVDAGVAHLGRLDIVSANAGILNQTGPMEAMSEETWSDMIDVNLSGVFRTCRVAIPHIKAGGRGGSVVLTSSAAGIKGAPNIGHYVAAKHGVVGLMRSLALEVAVDLIRVNSLHPTQVDTDMVMNEGTFRLFLPNSPNPSREEFAEAATPLQAMPVPWVAAVDVSNALVWLASEEARYVTGVALPVDAGMVIK